MTDIDSRAAYARALGSTPIDPYNDPAADEHLARMALPDEAPASAVDRYERARRQGYDAALDDVCIALASEVERLEGPYNAAHGQVLGLRRALKIIEAAR